MPREYSVRNVDGGDLQGKNKRLLSNDGKIIYGVYRVIFDDDDDEGMATISKFVTDEDGKLFRENGKLKHIHFRSLVKIIDREPITLESPSTGE